MVSKTNDKRKDLPQRFKKGNPGGPGRPRSPKHVKRLAKLTREQAKQLFIDFMHKSQTEIEAICKDKERTVLELSVARIALEAIKGADVKRADFLLDRSIGRVKEEIEVQMPKPMIVEDISTGKNKLLGAQEDAVDAEVVDDD